MASRKIWSQSPGFIWVLGMRPAAGGVSRRQHSGAGGAGQPLLAAPAASGEAAGGGRQPDEGGIGAGDEPGRDRRQVIAEAALVLEAGAKPRGGEEVGELRQDAAGQEGARSEERRVGKEGVSTSRSRWSPEQ